jgi:hypothetical protein
MTLNRWLALIWVCALLGGAQPLCAAELLNTPVYNPVTKSYFEMVDGAHGLTKGYNAFEGPTWRQANEMAQERVYKGARGRLAIIRDSATHQFLASTFHPETEVWVGLRYWCTLHQAQWSDGQNLKTGDFQIWDKVWRADPYACNTGTNDPNSEYAGIAYKPLPDFHWIGVGTAKRFYDFFVEYPTGEP